ncbi:MAG: DUF808 family protein, partial [Candidatus Electrothrix sp. ATG2]|nr:DUF808 family protein [Candidatus Electrothrix sp. ATG2]
QRMYSIFFQSWLKYRQFQQVSEEQDQAHFDRLFCLLGLGLYLVQYAQSMTGSMSGALAKVGHLLIASLPKIIRLLEVVGTAAMLLVGGGMYVHNIKIIHNGLHFMPIMLANLFAGLIVGFVLLFLLHFVQKIRST